jgi:hypothetical protein
MRKLKAEITAWRWRAFGRNEEEKLKAEIGKLKWGEDSRRQDTRRKRRGKKS